MGDRIVVMDGGEIQQVAGPADIYDRPANYFVAQFIGEITMNFADVTIEGDTVTSDEFGFQFSLDEEVADGEYLLGIRPEDVELVAPENGTGTATVDVTEPTGSEAVVYLMDSRDTRVAVDEESEFAVVVDRTNLPAEGVEIGFHIPPEKIHLFDPDTGEAVYHGRAKHRDAVTPTA